MRYMNYLPQRFAGGCSVADVRVNQHDDCVGSWTTERTLMDGYRSLTLPTLIFDKPVSREQVAISPGTIFDEMLDLMRKINLDDWAIDG